MKLEFGLPVAGDPAQRRPTVLTVGNFDGVHAGHRRLLQTLVTTARATGVDAAVVTFDPHPRCILDPDNCPLQLTTLDEKRDLLEREGVGRLVVLEFTLEMSRWPAAEFCARLLGAFDLRGLVVGHDFAVGYRRQGDIPYLTAWGGEHGFDVATVDAVAVGGRVASSSEVRAALLRGDLAVANAMLGHPYFLDSYVEPGAQRGRRIGYPTANLAITAGKCLPARGIYAAWVCVRGEWFMAAVSVGYNPTFGGDRLTVEAFLLDFAEDLYRERLRAAFVERIREERTYPSVAPLVEQIERDVEDVRGRLVRAPPPQTLRCVRPAVP